MVLFTVEMGQGVKASAEEDLVASYTQQKYKRGLLLWTV